MSKIGKYFFLLMAGMIFIACQQARKGTSEDSDPEQKQLLQGIWVDEDAETAVFKVSGDTIYYPGVKTQEVSYRISQDSLWIYGGNVLRYPLEQLTENVLRFRNQYGEEVKLVKSNEQYARDAFARKRQDTQEGSILNQTLQKHDTIVTAGGEKYHAYVCVNPTRYKVIRNTYDSDGVGVGKVYYDNIVNLNVYKGNSKVFSSDFSKQDFKSLIAQEAMTQGVFNDIEYSGTDGESLLFTATICIPESPSSYQVEIVISKDGKKSLKVK